MDWRRLLFWQKPIPARPLQVIATYPKGVLHDGDQRVITALQDCGADLSQKREVIHFFHLPVAGAAENVARTLRTGGYDVDEPLQTDALGETTNPWLVRATTYCVVNIQDVKATTSDFSKLASQQGGEYDGWEAAAKP